MGGLTAASVPLLLSAAKCDARPATSVAEAGSSHDWVVASLLSALETRWALHSASMRQRRRRVTQRCGRAIRSILFVTVNGAFGIVTDTLLEVCKL
jgi:hypothetical protein